MTANELRKKYVDFFVANGHIAISGTSLIPENDPTVLFTTAGMHPLVPYLLGEEHPAGKRLVNYQKCIRTGDIDLVGDSDHLTFFEMLGNWSLGDYFKEEAIRLSWEFLTDSRWLGIDPDRLSVTVFAGDDSAPRDDESAEAWRTMGVRNERIRYEGREHNWWGPAGQTGPCGPDTEMFIDTGFPYADGNHMEIWNDVFMQYEKRPDGSFAPLRHRCVDTGMGFERTVTILQGKASVYETELFMPIVAEIERLTGIGYGTDEDADRSIRIICDHVKAATFIIGDERSILPSNIGQGYILRRLIRRAMRHARKLSMEHAFLDSPARVVVDIYRDVYPILADRADCIYDELNAEEERFLTTLRKGEREFDKMLPRLVDNGQRLIPGKSVFHLYDTFGFPIELTAELATERGLQIDIEGFKQEFHRHREISKSDTKTAFRGGLSDHSDATTKLHTATHLLHQALRDVLGSHIAQRGSNITGERLRFDFSHSEKMSSEQLKRVEEIVNQKIELDLPVRKQAMPLQEALRKGAIALFTDRYQEMVKVYLIGNYSMEVCGGPHVEHTAELGSFRIVKEQSSSHGVRRIKAVLE